MHSQGLGILWPLSEQENGLRGPVGRAHTLQAAAAQVLT